MVESGRLRIFLHTLSYRVAALPPWGELVWFSIVGYKMSNDKLGKITGVLGG